MGDRVARRVLSLALSTVMIVCSIGYSPPPATATPPEPVRIREIVAQRTPTERVWLMNDGSFEREIHTGAINYFDETQQRFEIIDPSLVASDSVHGRRWVNRANSFKLALPDVIGDDWVSVTTSVSSVAFRPATRALPEAAIANRAPGAGLSPAPNKRAYPEAFSGASLEYVSGREHTRRTHEPDDLRRTRARNLNELAGGRRDCRAGAASHDGLR